MYRVEEIQPALKNVDFWRRHVDQFQQCKQSKLSYCKQHDLIYHRFLYWVSKLTCVDQKTSTVSSLIPLKLLRKADKNDVLASLTLSDGMTLSIHQEVALFNLIKRFG